VAVTAVATALAATTLTGCGAAGVTGGGLEGAIGSTYAHLYVRQQALQGHPPVTTRELAARATCDQGGPSARDTGTGNTWQCVIVWQVDGVDTPARARYHVEVRTDGSYVADGEELVDEQHSIVGPDGISVTNPLWQFEGSLSTAEARV
jgi:hypothetical protein